MATTNVRELLGNEADALLSYKSKTIPSSQIHLPGPSFIDDIFGPSNRTPQVLRSLGSLLGTGRLARTGFLSILPIDQGIEHSGGASFAKNPIYFDPENILKLTME